MCFINGTERKPSKEYQVAWKLFLEQVDGLHSPIKNTETIYQHGQKYSSDGWGFYAFTSEADALGLKELAEESKMKGYNKWPKGQFVVKKVQVQKIDAEGFCVCHWYQSDILLDGKNHSELKTNAIRFHEMTIL